MAIVQSKRLFCSRHCWCEHRKSQFVERFWAKVSKTETCWLWCGAKVPDGYGSVKLPGSLNTTKTHRLSWEWAYGPVPKGMLVCHKCDTPACVRPDHLFLGTHKDNSADRDAKQRRIAFGAMIGTSKLTDEKVREIRQLYHEGYSQQVIADEFGMHQTTIGDIVRQERWRHVK